MYFRTPFAASGTRTAVPNDVQVDGTVSYTDGFGVDYSLNPTTDPAAKLIDRGQQNFLDYEITLAVQRLQQFYAPDWIASADNGGTPFAYNNGAIVLYIDGAYWQSIAAANTATPGTDPAKWILFLSNLATAAALAAEVTRAEAAEAVLAAEIAAVNSVPTGAVFWFGAATAPAGYLECNGASLLRAGTYAALFAIVGTTFGNVDGTHFNLPDLRGEFVRGWDDGRGVDSGRAFGSTQTDTFAAHSHTVPFFSDNSGNSGPGHGGTTSSTVASGTTGSPETRPKNVALLPCIKI